jgi:hypothetical protein
VGHLYRDLTEPVSYKTIATTLLAGLFVIGLAACEKGAAEKAGEAIDDAASDVADSAEDAVDAAKKKLEE